MKKRFTINVDMDGVLADITTPWLRLYNAEYDDTLTKTGIRSWDTHLWTKVQCGKRMYDYLDEPGLFEDAPLEHAVDDCFRRLCADHDVRIVTATPKNSKMGYYEKRKWIKRMFPWFDIDERFASTNNKNLIPADVLIDDGIHNLRKFPGLAICLSQPWNITAHPMTYDIFCADWLHVMYVVDRLASDEEFRHLHETTRAQRLMYENSTHVVDPR